MTSREAIRLVAVREINQRLRTKSFPAYTLLTAAVILAIGIIARLTSDDGPSRVTIGVAGAAPAGLDAALQQAGTASDRAVTVQAFATPQEAEAALRDGDVDAVIVPESGRVLFDEEVDTTTNTLVAQGWAAAKAREAAAAAGLSPEEVTSILSPPPLRTEVLDADDDPGVGILVGFLTAILLFITVNTFGTYVLTGVVEEKTSAVVEVLLARVRAHILLAGKVFGIGVVALIQLAVAVVAGIAALVISGREIPTDVWFSIPSTLLWFMGGFALYSTLFALAGSFVSRQEDAQAAAAPISICFLAAYLLVFTAGTDPNGTLARVLSILPPFAPLLMPLRIAVGSASWWEIALSVVLLLASVWVVLRLAGGVYARTLLHRGSRITWRQALQLRRT